MDKGQCPDIIAGGTLDNLDYASELLQEILDLMEPGTSDYLLIRRIYQDIEEQFTKLVNESIQNEELPFSGFYN